MRSLALFGFFSLLVACGGAVESVGGPSPEPSASTPGGGTPSPAPTQPPAIISPGPTPAPAPAADVWPGKAAGCGDFQVNTWNQAGTKAIVVEAFKNSLAFQDFNTPGATVKAVLGTKNETADVRMDVYPRAPKESPYCSDVIVDNVKPTVWTAKSGTATFELVSLGRDTPGYTVTVTLENVVMKSPDGTTQSIPKMTLPSVYVGWYAG